LIIFIFKLLFSYNKTNGAFVMMLRWVVCQFWHVNCCRPSVLRDEWSVMAADLSGIALPLSWCFWFHCGCFFCLSHSEARALFVRGGHSLSNYCVTVYGSILMQFSPFFGSHCPFRWTR